MKKYMKRIACAAVLTAVCLGATMQLGLPQMAYAARESADAPVILTVDGTPVRMGEYADYFSYCKAVLEGSFGMGPYVWAMYPEATAELIQQTDGFCIYARVVVNEFEKLGLRLDRSRAWDYKTTKRQVSEQLAAQGMTFEYWLQSMGLTEEVYQNILVQGYYLEALDNYYFGEGGEKAPAESEIRAAYEEFMRAKHILISSVDEAGSPLTGDALAKREALVQEIQQKLAEGEDFDALMQKHSEDPGLISMPDGYTFRDNGEFMPEFVEGTQALQIGEISPEPARTDYGWHIIRREPLTEDDYEQLRPQLVYELTGETIDDLISSLMDTAAIEFAEGHDELTVADVLGEAAAPSLEDMMGGEEAEPQDGAQSEE